MPQPLRTTVNRSKETDLPVGVTKTWRKRTKPQKTPYLEFQVCYNAPSGAKRVAHFYAGVAPAPMKVQQARMDAMLFRMVYVIARFRQTPFDPTSARAFVSQVRQNNVDVSWLR